MGRALSGRLGRRGDGQCHPDPPILDPVLQEHFVRAVPWNLPTGVTFHTPRPGFLAADIQSTMTGIRALSTRRGCLAQMHSAAPACLIERQHRVPLQMRFTVLADFSALR